MRCLLFNYEFFLGEQVFAFLRDKPLATIATVIDLWFVQVDVDLGMAQCPSAPVTPGVGPLYHYHRLLCQQGDGKLIVHLTMPGRLLGLK